MCHLLKRYVETNCLESPDLRIAYLSSACIPSRTANSIHVMKMCQALAHDGHEVVLFAQDKVDERELDVSDPFVYYGVESNFSIEHFPWLPVKARGYWYGWLAARRAMQHGVELVFGRHLVACFFASRFGLPVIYEAHKPVSDDGRLALYLFERLIRSSSFRTLVVITDALRYHFLQTWPELEDRIVVAPDGADPLARAIEPVELGLSETSMQIGYTGHLYAGKGAELVVNLAHACPQHAFHLVGGTRSDLQYWNQRVDLPTNLRLHGHQPHGLLPGYLVAFDIVLLPNQLQVSAHGGRRDVGRWTSPLKLFEYMAAGRAIVCSDVPVLQEIAEDGVNMLVCRHDDLGQWVEALDSLARDPDLRHKLGTTARTQLESRYTWAARAKRVVNDSISDINHC